MLSSPSVALLHIRRLPFGKSLDGRMRPPEILISTKDGNAPWWISRWRPNAAEVLSEELWVAGIAERREHREVLMTFHPPHDVTRVLTANQHQVPGPAAVRVILVVEAEWIRQHVLDGLRVGTHSSTPRQQRPRQMLDQRSGRVDVTESHAPIELLYDFDRCEITKCQPPGPGSS